MPITASKRKARQRSAQDSYDSPSTIFERPDAVKNVLTDEQIADISQPIENKIARKVKDEIRRTENTFLKALGFLRENPLLGEITSMDAEVTPGEESANMGQFGYHGLESDQENLDPGDSYASVQPDVHDAETNSLVPHCLRQNIEISVKRDLFGAHTTPPPPPTHTHLRTLLKLSSN